MLNDRFGGQTLGAGTHTRKYWDEYVAGNIGDSEWIAFEARMTRTPGTCNTMGTASTMTSIVEAMGLTLPGATSIPAMDAAHSRMAWQCGQRIVEMVREDLTPARILTSSSFLNGIAAYMALGGSTNAAVHLLAMAGRAGVRITLDDLEAMARRVPVLANLYPSGNHLMEDFHFAGGLPALMTACRPLDLDSLTVTAARLGATIAGRRCIADDVIHTLARRFTGGRDRLLRGNLRRTARHEARRRGPALFSPSRPGDRLRDYEPWRASRARRARRERPRPRAAATPARSADRACRSGASCRFRESCVQSRRARHGARFRRTHERHDYGTCILHVAPEVSSAARWRWCRPARVAFDVAARKPSGSGDEELARAAPPGAATAAYARGYTLYSAHVAQADEGCDFDFLAGTARIAEPEIHSASFRDAPKARTRNP